MKSTSASLSRATLAEHATMYTWVTNANALIALMVLTARSRKPLVGLLLVKTDFVSKLVIGGNAIATPDGLDSGARLISTIVKQDLVEITDLARISA